MKTIGVLGGMGPQATIDFEARLHHVSQQLIPPQNNSGYPPLVVYYFRELPSITPSEGSMATTRSEVNPRMLDAAKRLGSLVDFLAIPCNGAHIYFDQIVQAAGCHAINMIDTTVAEVQRRGLRRVGILDFRAAGVGLYHHRLSALGVPWEITPPELLAPLFGAVLAVQEGRSGAEVGEPARQALQHLRAKPVDGIIMGCTEIPFMLGDAASRLDLPRGLGGGDSGRVSGKITGAGRGGAGDVGSPADGACMLNPVQLLAEAAVRYALE